MLCSTVLQCSKLEDLQHPIHIAYKKLYSSQHSLLSLRAFFSEAAAFIFVHDPYLPSPVLAEAKRSIRRAIDRKDELM